MNRLILIAVLSIGAAITATSLGGCFSTSVGKPKEGEYMPRKSIKQVLNERADEWMSVPGVVGTTIGTFKGKPCIKIFTSSKPQELQAKFPSTVESYPVIIEETGTFHALNLE